MHTFKFIIFTNIYLHLKQRYTYRKGEVNTIKFYPENEMKEKSVVWSFHNRQLSGCWLFAAHILFAFKDPEHSENIYPKPRKLKKKIFHVKTSL